MPEVVSVGSRDGMPGVRLDKRGKGMFCLPREGFLAKVNIPLGLPLAHGASELVSQRTCSTGRDASGADTLLHLLVNEGLDVGSTREHLHAGGGRVDFLCAPRPGNEQQD